MFFVLTSHFPLFPSLPHSPLPPPHPPPSNAFHFIFFNTQGRTSRQLETNLLKTNMRPQREHSTGRGQPFFAVININSSPQLFSNTLSSLCVARECSDSVAGGGKPKSKDSKKFGILPFYCFIRKASICRVFQIPSHF